MWDAITHPCPNFNGGLFKPPLKLAHGLVITSPTIYVKTIAYPCLNLNALSVEEGPGCP